ncbi:MAG TPA: hypothetical protein VGJ93_07320 [Desulfuromonadaceae bacterium]|jgi:hypothetical protein
MKWAVEIQKTDLDRRNLTDLLDGLGFKVIDGIQFPAFTSPEIDRCVTAADVYDRAKQLRAAIAGPAQIDPDFALGVVIDFSTDPPKQHGFLEVESLISKSTIGNITLTIAPPNGLSVAELERWERERDEQLYQNKLEDQRARLEPAFRSSRAAKVLQLLSIEMPSGETLNKIYELAEGHPDNRVAFLHQVGVSREQFRRFQDAVHNPRVSGDWARHGYDDIPKTNNPMSRAEAEQFVRQIAAEWLHFVRTSGR